MSPEPKSKILLPLYIYPDSGAWDPLFKVIEANLTLEFVVIVNPNNGPGTEPWWPNADYLREIPRLAAFPNVKVVGYVFTSYCKRPVEEVYADIEAYAAWSRDQRCPGLCVQGIFFDETPNVYSEAAGAYLRDITAKARSTEGIAGLNIVIHNPGTAVDRRFASGGPDITTVAEVAYEQFQTVEYQNWLATSPYRREKTGYMIHSVPEERIEESVKAMRQMADYLFMTDNRLNFYHSFARCWERFVEAMVKP